MFAQKHLQGRSIAIIEKIAALTVGAFFLLSPLVAKAEDPTYTQKQMGGSYFSQVIVCIRALDPNTGGFLEGKEGLGRIAQLSYAMEDRKEPITVAQRSQKIKFESEQFGESGCFRVLNASREAKIYRVSLNGAQGLYQDQWYRAEVEKGASGKELTFRVPENDNSNGMAGALIVPMRIVLIKDKKSEIDKLKEKFPSLEEESAESPMHSSRSRKAMPSEAVSNLDSNSSAGATN